MKQGIKTLFQDAFVLSLIPNFRRWRFRLTLGLRHWIKRCAAIPKTN
jgi:hypothetical protein